MENGDHWITSRRQDKQKRQNGDLEMDQVQGQVWKSFQGKDRQSTSNKRIRYCPRYHKGSNKGSETIIGININNKGIKFLQANEASSDYEQ